MAPYKLLIFDWDGTLVDSTAQIVTAVHQATKTLGLPEHSSQYIRLGIGLNFEQQMHRLWPTTKLSVQEVRAVFTEHYQAIASNRTVFVDDAKTMLAHFKTQGYTLAIATGKSKSGLESVLAHEGLEDTFAMWCCGDQYPSKPDPAMLNTILESLLIESEHALMVGDSVYDMGAAKEAKVDAFAVLTGVNTEEELLRYNPVACEPSIAALPAFLASSSR